MHSEAVDQLQASQPRHLVDPVDDPDVCSRSEASGDQLRAGPDPVAHAIGALQEANEAGGVGTRFCEDLEVRFVPQLPCADLRIAAQRRLEEPSRRVPRADTPTSRGLGLPIRARRPPRGAARARGARPPPRSRPSPASRHVPLTGTVRRARSAASAVPPGPTWRRWLRCQRRCAPRAARPPFARDGLPPRRFARRAARGLSAQPRTGAPRSSRRRPSGAWRSPPKTCPLWAPSSRVHRDRRGSGHLDRSAVFGPRGAWHPIWHSTSMGDP
jgi:hypothetical protein